MSASVRVAILAAALATTLPAAAQPADIILLNGKVLTLDAQSTITHALAIAGERILASGSDASVRPHTAPTTRTIDLGGRTVIPGLIDSHIHAIRAGLRFATEVSWIGATTIEEALARIRAAAATTTAGSWIVVGGGWTPAQFTERRRPTEAEVTAAAKGGRVYIQLFYRNVLLSEAARHAFAIAADTDLPPGAKFERGDDGTPNGWIAGNTAAITELYERLPRPSREEASSGTRRFFTELNKLGITGVIDPGGHNLAPEEYETLLQLWQTSGLTVRVAYSISAPRPGTELADLQGLTRFLPMGFGYGMLRFNGIGERVTWGLYNNETPTDAQKDAFVEVGRWAAARGLTLTAHWHNDRSVHHLLEAMERVDREIPIRRLRWSIAHLHDASDASLQRMKALGVGWTMQNGLYFAAATYIAARGSAMDRAPPIKTAMRLGIAIGGGTDAHRVMSYNPFVSLRWMTDGRTVDGLPTRASAERITREEALRLYTQGSAWFTFDENQRGTLEPGRLADLAVLDRDYISVPASELASTRSLLTMVGGHIVHAEQPFSAKAE